MTLARTLLPFAILTSFQTQPTSIYIPTSDALQVARLVARDEGYSLRNSHKYFFDTVTLGSTPPFNEYTTIGFYWNSDLVSNISINKRTAQVVDINMCYVFDYPDVVKYQDKLRQNTDAWPDLLDKLAKDLDCSSLKIITKPNRIPGALH